MGIGGDVVSRSLSRSLIVHPLASQFHASAVSVCVRQERECDKSRCDPHFVVCVYVVCLAGLRIAILIDCVSIPFKPFCDVSVSSEDACSQVDSAAKEAMVKQSAMNLATAPGTRACMSVPRASTTYINLRGSMNMILSIFFRQAVNDDLLHAVDEWVLPANI